MLAPTVGHSSVLPWSDQLATGLSAIDAEHRQLIDLINALGELHRRHATVEQLRHALADLRAYTVYHFRTETELMQRHPVNEANKRSHLAAHRGFVARLDSFDALVATDPATVIECLLAFTVKWLVHHVTGVDARLAREIAMLESGTEVAVVDGAGTTYNALIDTVSELYDGMAARTFELLHANQQLQAEISRRQQVEEQLRISAIVFDAVDEAVMVTNADNQIVRVNPSFSRITGYSVEEAIGANPRMLSGRTHPPEFYQSLWSTLLSTGKWQGEIRNRRKNGELFVEWLSIYRVIDQVSGGFHHVAVFSDITKQRMEADRIQYLANFDLLTGLPNRAALMERMRVALTDARREQTQLAIMFVDLDLFKTINDALGHDIGDLLLQSVAGRMREILPESGMVGRLGGDEFVVLLPGVVDATSALGVATGLRDAIALPFELEGHRVCISCSIGIAMCPEHGTDEMQLLKDADTAMYRAKVGGRDAVEYFRLIG